MGKKSAPKPPPAPDPNQMVAQQMQANRVNEVTPFGSISYSGGDGGPYTRTLTLDPAERRLLDTQRNAEFGLANLANDALAGARPGLSRPFSLASLGAAPQADAANRQRVEEALFQRLKPQMDQDRSALETQLANQGFDRNSEAYNRALDSQNRARNDARLAVTAQGGAEQSRLFGLESAARQQAINELLLQRSQPLNEIASLLGTGQVNVPQMGGITPVDVMSPAALQYQGQMNAYNQAQNQRRSSMGGLFGLAGTLGGAALGGPMGAQLGGWLGSKLGG